MDICSELNRIVSWREKKLLWSIQTDYYIENYDLVKIVCIEGARIAIVLARTGAEQSVK